MRRVDGHVRPVTAQAAPQAGQCRIDGIGCDFRMQSIQGGVDRRLCHHAAGMAHQQFEKRDFPRRHIDVLAIHVHLPRHRIE